jgi:hypothetical protein
MPVSGLSVSPCHFTDVGQTLLVLRLFALGPTWPTLLLSPGEFLVPPCQSVGLSRRTILRPPSFPTLVFDLSQALGPLPQTRQLVCCLKSSETFCLNSAVVFSAASPAPTESSTPLSPDPPVAATRPQVIFFPFYHKCKKKLKLFIQHAFLDRGCNCIHCVPWTPG